MPGHDHDWLESVEAKVVIMRRLEQGGRSAGAANLLSIGLDFWISSGAPSLALHVARLISNAEPQVLAFVVGTVYSSYVL